MMFSRLKNVSISLAVSAFFLGIMAVLSAFHTYHAGKTYEYSIHGSIGYTNAERFRVFMKDKRKADLIKIHIESFGGLMLSMNKYVYHLNNTKAGVVCFVDSHASSAAAFILLNCPNVLVAPSAEVLFHLPRVCTKQGLLGCEKIKLVGPTYLPKVYRQFIRFISPFKYLLTKQEWSSMIKGKDVTILGEVLMRRIRNNGVRYVYPH